MTESELAKLERLFNAAMAKPPEERARFLDEQCGEDADLRAKIDTLLENEDCVHPDFLRNPFATGEKAEMPTGDASLPRKPTPRDKTGSCDGSSDLILGQRVDDDGYTWIGHYRILEKLGEGGMGVVYLAEQTEPIHRRVAIKVIKPGMDSKAVIARFEAERQALEKMDHPNIAKILDAGMTDRQLPYFVMEHVKGDPICEHADRARLGIEERLELFIQVCEAVQHAHHKGIIHRDIKPTNILVSWDETRAVPKVIDFGVARATDQSGNEPAFTKHGELIGTPEYMSPEQLEMGAQNIDTRTDIYALGVVLYELLTGVLPFDSRTLRQAGIDAIRKIIREVEPPRPSKRLHTLPASGDTTLGTVSKARKTDSRRLARLLRNDLDWVVMKCLEKRRDRRYSTPSALALDLRRFLSGETVLTGPPDFSYHLRKFVRRHRASVSAAALVALALMAGLVATMAQLRRAEASEARTRELAVSLINEFHDNVEHLPGALRARKRFVELGIAYLEEAQQRGTGDTNLQLDIADAYDKLGDVAGGLRTPHVGDLELAMELFDKARLIRRRVQDNNSNNPRVAIGLAHSALNKGDVHREQRTFVESIEAYRQGLEILDGPAANDQGNKDAQIERALLLVSLSNVLGRNPETKTSSERLELFEEAEKVTRKLVSNQLDEDTLEAQARVLSSFGAYLMASKPDVALLHLEKSTSIRNELFDADPINSSRRRKLASSLFHIGRVQVELGQNALGMERFNEALVHFQFLIAADPTDAEARARLSQVYERIGMNAASQSEKLDAFRIAVSHSKRVAQETSSPKSLWTAVTQLNILAYNLNKEGLPAEAMTYAESGFANASELLRTNPAKPESLRVLARAADHWVDALLGVGAAHEYSERWALLSEALANELQWIDAQDTIDHDNKHITTLRAHLETCKELLARIGLTQSAPP